MNKNNFLSFEEGIDFIENILGIKLLEYQKMFVREVWNNNITLCEGCGNITTFVKSIKDRKEE